MYTVYGQTQSRAFRVIWMLEELGVPYEHVPLAPRSDELVALNPLGKLPVLRDGDLVVQDSTAILTYLADKHGALTFPAGTPERAHQDGITGFLLDTFDAAIWTAARHSFVLPKERRVAGIKESLIWEFEQNQAHAVRFLGEGPFLMGDTITIADILLANCLSWARIAKFPIVEPALKDYAKALSDRPAFRRALER